MIPLALLFLITIFVFFERYIAIQKASRLDANFMNIIRDHILSGNLSAAKSFAKNNSNPVARIIDKGIQRVGKPIDYIERNMENVAQLEMFKLEKNLGVLSVISRAAPIFGFIGTLAGLMQLFFKINSTNEFELNTIAGGIYVKLVTSISGLVIGTYSTSMIPIRVSPAFKWNACSIGVFCGRATRITMDCKVRASAPLILAGSCGIRLG